MRLVCGVFAVVAAFGIVISAQAQNEPPDPQQVIATYSAACASGDVNAALAQFADDAVVTVQNRNSRSYAGKPQIRDFLQAVAVRLRTTMRSSPLIQGNTITWTERDTVEQQAFDATVVATVRSGQIAALIYRTNDGTGNLLARATEPQRLELPNAMWAALLAGIGLLLLAGVFGRPRRPASQSQLDGRLMIELRRRARQSERDERAA